MRRISCGAVVCLLMLAAVASSASAASPTWTYGTTQTFLTFDCGIWTSDGLLSGDVGGGGYAGYYGTPTAGSVYYLGVAYEAGTQMVTTAGTCLSSQDVSMQIALPPDSQTAVSSSYPIVCFDNGASFTVGCPTNVETGTHGGEAKVDPDGGAQVWSLDDLSTLEVAIPVTSSVPTASTTAGGDIRIWDGFEPTTSSPWEIEPTVSYPVAAATTTTSTTSSSTQPTTSTTTPTTSTTTSTTTPTSTSHSSSTTTSSTTTPSSTTTTTSLTLHSISTTTTLHTLSTVSTSTTSSTSSTSTSTLTLTSISLRCPIPGCRTLTTFTTASGTPMPTSTTTTTTSTSTSVTSASTTTSTSGAPAGGGPSSSSGPSSVPGSAGGAGAGSLAGGSGVGGVQLVVPPAHVAAFSAFRCASPQTGKVIDCSVLVNAAKAKLSLAAYEAPVTGSIAAAHVRKKVVPKPTKLGTLALASTGSAGHHSLKLMLTQSGAALLVKDKQLKVTVDLAVTAPGSLVPSAASQTIVLNAPRRQHARRR